MSKVFVLGSINIDLVFDVERIPKSGETIKSKGFFMTPGGKGANQAVACVKQGTETIMIGSIGSGYLSKICKNTLENYGVDCQYLDEIKDETCGIAGILLEKSNNRIIIHSGANAIHNIKRIKRILEDSGGDGDILISQFEIPIDIIRESFKIAKSMGIKTVFNAAPATKLSHDFLELIDLLVVNEREMETLTTITADTENNVKIAAKFLLDSGVRAVLITLGEKGSVYLDSTNFIKRKAYTVDVIDTTAAGDAYIGAFISNLLVSGSLENAMDYATATSALTIQKLGAQTAIPDKKQVEKFLKDKKELNDE